MKPLYFFVYVSLFCSFSVLSSTSSNISARAKQDDQILAELATRTQMFAQEYAPLLKTALRVGSKEALSQIFNPYRDKNLGPTGQSLSDFRRKNAQQLRNLQQSDDLMSERPPQDRSLSMSQARALLDATTAISRQTMGKISGACFLRATFIAHEVSQKYPRVPVIKAWLYGSMMSQSEKWPYHVAPLVPVQSNGAVQWMVLDTLLASSGPVSLEEWVELTHQEHSFTSEVKLFFSAADRVGAAFNITLEQLLYTQYGTTWEQALFEAEAQAD